MRLRVQVLGWAGLPGVSWAGYAHLFVRDASIDHCESASVCTLAGSRVAGTYDSHVDILSAQYTHTF